MVLAASHALVRVTRRALHAAGPLRAITTKKVYEDLPKLHILPDGSPAQPLEEWHATTNAEVLADKKPRKRAKRLVEVENEKQSRKTKQAAKDGSPLKKRVSRKSKDESTQATETEGATGQRGSLLPEVLENLQRFPHCLLFTRVGKFYESYYDQAHEVARLLNIKLAYRKWSHKAIPFCGFPLQHIDKYLKILVQQNGRFVALCEEFPRYGPRGILSFDRRVARVVTPGTLIDESFLNQYENNYLLAISPAAGEPEIGLAWIDVSTGEFYTKPVASEALRDELTRISPREIVLDKCWEPEQEKPPLLRDALAEEAHCISYTLPNSDGSAFGGATPTPEDDISAENAGIPLLAEYTSREQAAVTLLTSYLRANLLEHMPTLSTPAREGMIPRMQIDSHTIKALEIRESMREGGVKGSLLSVVKRTSTTSGTRLLARWLCSPSTSVSEISARQSLVAFFYSRDHFRADLMAALAGTEDAGRIVQRFLLGRGDANDLHAVNSTIDIWASIKHRIAQERQQEELELADDFQPEQWASLDALMARMADLSELANHIGRALQPKSVSAAPSDSSGSEGDEEGDSEAAQLQAPEMVGTKPAWRIGDYNWVIKPDYTEKLLSLHTALDGLLTQRESLQDRLQLQYDAPSLTLRSSPAHGMHVHLLKAKRDAKKLSQDEAFVGIAESGTTKCYFFSDWAQLGGRIIETANALLAAEKEAFESLRAQVNSHSAQLRRNARILDELDVTLAFGNLAKKMGFVRPTLTESPVYDVVNGRHPTVELGLLTNGRVFTPNSVQISPESRLQIITGPNMAGKSTFLRQTALIAVLAQAGSFVPADSAIIGIVDKLFSRVGAKDDLFHDRSTFMVEMLETAEILQRATPRSLVIMDEVGRGTTVKDGLAIAFATVHHLVVSNKCRALFATHFHEIADMLGYPEANAFGNVAFYCTDVDETDDGHFAYSYRMRPGVNRDSHGLKVAQIAGMPNRAVRVASDALNWLKSSNNDGASPQALNQLGQTLIANADRRTE
ncbi:DNA mismatch repair protein [Mycena kentingensis (nom. inval.)]|nr:DNA mismatch repair protein [Mycena kentingensis (nom. inval.)]